MQIHEIQAHWNIRADTTYLNHGSFGPPPRAVREARAGWQATLDEQPMDFFVRRWDAVFDELLEAMAEFVGTRRPNLAAVDNATVAMNAIAYSYPLLAGQKVLLSDHEYGVVTRTWQRACDQVGAELDVMTLPFPIEDRRQVVEAFERAFDDDTRLLVVSHITSPTGIIMPVAEITAAARRRGIDVCIDGPHAPLQVPIDLDSLDCDFYVASGHKWLCAPFGSGLLYVHPRQQHLMQSPTVSWGRQPPRETWDDGFLWWGTRDPSANLAMRDAVRQMREFGVERFREYSGQLALSAREKIIARFPLDGLVRDPSAWQASMTLARLPDGDAAALQKSLWDRYRIEIPIIDWHNRRWVRVSCHWYNDERQLDQLVQALVELLQ